MVDISRSVSVLEEIVYAPSPCVSHCSFLIWLLPHVVSDLFCIYFSFLLLQRFPCRRFSFWSSGFGPAETIMGDGKRALVSEDQPASHLWPLVVAPREPGSFILPHDPVSVVLRGRTEIPHPFTGWGQVIPLKRAGSQETGGAFLL